MTNCLLFFARSVSSRLRLRVTDLLETTKAQEKRICDLLELVQELEVDNSQLREDQQWRKETIMSLQNKVGVAA